MLGFAESAFSWPHNSNQDLSETEQSTAEMQQQSQPVELVKESGNNVQVEVESEIEANNQAPKESNEQLTDSTEEPE